MTRILEQSLTPEQIDQLAEICDRVRTHGYGSVTIQFNKGHPQRIEENYSHVPAYFPFRVRNLEDGTEVPQ